MSMFDNLRDEVAKAAEEHPDLVEKVSDEVIHRGGDAIDQATGDKFAQYVDKGEQVADERIGE